jgi:hypothetical protein
LSVPMAAYASQTAYEGNSVKAQAITQSFNSDNHDYRQPVWLDSSDNGHFHEPPLWL